MYRYILRHFNIIMSKLVIFTFVTTSSLAVLTDLPIFFLFGIVSAGLMLEADKVQKQIFPFIRAWFLSAIIGWGTSFGIKKMLPTWFE